jgi:dTDP-4-dehydrorhamnose 3,5-epimerase-like enzyme
MKKEELIKHCVLTELPKICDTRGNLTFIEEMNHIPFEIKRVFYIYDIPTAVERGAHAHKQNHQYLICLSGSMDVLLDDGTHKKEVHLNRPWQGLHIPPLIWASEANFSPNTLYVVLASEAYDEDDYYREYNDFLDAVRGNGL